MEELYMPSLLSLRKNNMRGKNADSTMLENRSLVLRIIKDDDPVSRSALVQKTGLRNATITLIVDEFLAKGLIARRGLVEGENGRRVMGFGIKGGAFCVAAVRLNVSYIAVALYDINMKPVAVSKKFMDTFADLPRTCRAIADEVEQLRTQADGRRRKGPIRIAVRVLLALLILGAAGVLFTLLMLAVREPARRGVGAGVAVPLAEVGRYIRSNRRTVLCHNFGFAGLALFTLPVIVLVVALAPLGRR